MIIIPARLGSSRFPSKVLADVAGMPMVIKTAKAVEDIDKVVIATDSKEVLDIAKSFNIEAVITSSLHRSGTDRIYEAAKKLSLDESEIIINVQADEPFIESKVVESVYNLTKKHIDSDIVLATSAYKKVTNPEADDPNIVKVVTDSSDVALYFSRSKIPYPRDHHFDEYKAHLGLYGYTMRSLSIYCSLAKSSLEDIEKLEQLRILEAGYKIAMVEVESNSFGIDTYEDLERALRIHTL